MVSMQNLGLYIMKNVLGASKDRRANGSLFLRAKNTNPGVIITSKDFEDSSPSE
jgi:hypothetical protein